MTQRSRRAVGLWIAIVAHMAMITHVSAYPLSASGHSEYEVKAAYLYNFGRFVAWPRDVPADHAPEFTICVLGRDPFGPALDTTISGEKIGGRSVVASRISEIEKASTCRVLFISSSESKRLKEVLAGLGRRSILTVSDMPEFVQQGGMVQFVLAEERVRFEINKAAAQQAGLSLSSELLKVAVKVRE